MPRAHFPLNWFAPLIYSTSMNFSPPLASWPLVLPCFPCLASDPNGSRETKKAASLSAVALFLRISNSELSAPAKLLSLSAVFLDRHYFRRSGLVSSSFLPFFSFFVAIGFASLRRMPSLGLCPRQCTLLARVVSRQMCAPQPAAKENQPLGAYFDMRLWRRPGSKFLAFAEFFNTIRSSYFRQR